ncbi:hypothetical protein M0R45_008661 [Rubus argutus]|uniref:Uncharacterized protein n=1 Tax=Rubus argutus TaxID=59490 RepID=A0AAW1Y5Q0_RUBAR
MSRPAWPLLPASTPTPSVPWPPPPFMPIDVVAAPNPQLTCAASLVPSPIDFLSCPCSSLCRITSRQDPILPCRRFSPYTPIHAAHLNQPIVAISAHSVDAASALSLSTTETTRVAHTASAQSRAQSTRPLRPSKDPSLIPIAVESNLPCRLPSSRSCSPSRRLSLSSTFAGLFSLIGLCRKPSMGWNQKKKNEEHK